MTINVSLPSEALPAPTCSDCRTRHPAVTYMNAAQVATFTGYSLATVYSYHSRKVLPPAAGRKGGSPRWLACDIGRWLLGAAERPEPGMPTKRA